VKRPPMYIQNKGESPLPEAGKQDALEMEEANLARFIHDACGPLLLEEIGRELVEPYREAIYKTRRMMEECRMGARCAVCADQVGSCCFEEVSGWYDPVLLLMNLLLGVPLPEERLLKGHCFFVGERGCRLLARHSFCVNYLCPDLKSSLGPSLCSRFSSVAGEEIRSGWELEKFIRLWIGRHEAPFQSKGLILPGR
jgi:hypothetical protein